MGHSPSIADLKRQNQEFNDYMAQATANLKNRANDQRSAFQTAIDNIYKGQDQRIMGSGSNTDYKQATEFSLEPINKAMDAIAAAVFSGGSPPDGTVMGEAKEAIGIAAEMASFEALALVAARAFIVQVLGVFDTTASTSFHNTVSSKTLSPGLMLHVWNYGDAFQRKDFFNNEFIIENVIEFQLIYSFAQAKTQADIDYMKAHSDEIEDLDQKIVTLQKEIDEKVANIDEDLPQGQPAGWQARIDYLKASLEKYRQEVKSLLADYPGKNQSKPG